MRYFFHVHVIDGESQVDDIGADFPSDARAIEEARKFVRDIMVEAAEGGTCLTYIVEVTDPTGRSIVRLEGQVKHAETT
jgi:hypothetical protein